MFNRAGIRAIQNGSCDISPAQARTKRVSVLHFPVCTGSCGMSSGLSTAKKPLIGSLHTHLAKKPVMEIFVGDLAKRPRDLANRALIRDLVQRSCQETSNRDLVQVSEESRGLPRRIFIDIA